MPKLCRVTNVKVLFLFPVLIFNFNLFEFSAAILEKGLSFKMAAPGKFQNQNKRLGNLFISDTNPSIRPCHTAAILSRETKKALFYHAKPHPHGFHCEAWRGKTKLFWSPGTIWPPCDKGELEKVRAILTISIMFSVLI